MWGRLHVKTTQIPPFFCCIPVFQSFLSIYYFILCKFFTLAKKIRRSAGHRCIFICILLFFFFSCSSDSGPSKEDFMKRVQIPDDEEAKCQRWWRARKQEIAWASCVRVVFISRIFIHTVRKGNFATQDWTEAGETKCSNSQQFLPQINTESHNIWRFHKLIVCFLSRRELGTPLFTQICTLTIARSIAPLCCFSFDILTSKIRN